MSLDPLKEILSLSFDHEGAHMAMCHKAQGFGANGRPEALIIKSDAEITDEVLADAELIKSGKDLPDKKDSLSEGDPDVKTEEIIGDGDNSKQPSENNSKQTQGELMATDQEKLEKTQNDLDALMAKFETMEKAAETAELEKSKMATKIEAFEKAAEKEAFEKVKTQVASYSFITDEDQEEVTKSLIELDSGLVIDLLDKAQAAVDAVEKVQGAEGTNEFSMQKSSSSLMDKLKAKHKVGDKA